MRIIRIPTSAGIDDIKIIGETDIERQFIKQLAEAGSLSSISRMVADSVVFRVISTGSENSGHYSSGAKIGRFDFEVIQNQETVYDLTFNSLTEPATPIDLTQYTAIKLQVKRKKGESAIVELSLGSGLSVIGEDFNKLHIAFTAEQTSKLCLDSYCYDVLMAKPGANVYYVEGTINPRKTGTR